LGERKPLCRFATSPLEGRIKVLNVDTLSPCQGGVPEGRGVLWKEKKSPDKRRSAHQLAGEGVYNKKRAPDKIQGS